MKDRINGDSNSRDIKLKSYLQYMRIPTRITRQMKVRADTTTSGITVFCSARPIRRSWLLLLASVVGENWNNLYLNFANRHNTTDHDSKVLSHLPFYLFVYGRKHIYIFANQFKANKQTEGKAQDHSLRQLHITAMQNFISQLLHFSPFSWKRDKNKEKFEAVLY